MDYRKVYEVTRKDVYLLPWIGDTLEALRRSPFHGHALRLVQGTGNFRVSHGACAL